MVTKIKNTNVRRLGRLTGRRVSSTTTPQTTAKSSSRKDDVELSSLSRTIGMAGEAMQNSPDIRSELVDPIREALEDGRYHVSSLDVADKILRQVLKERKKSV
ncbi:MAG: flagellar biosynthesis anti-sigma factor FlgM [Magnetococcus sp. DMHC-6]